MPKKRMFKQTSTVHLENVGEDGNWNSFLRILKQQDQMTSAYIDYVKVSFIRADQQSVIGVNDSSLGVMFCASTASNLSNSDPASNSKYIISSNSSNTTTCEPVYLSIKRSVRANEIDPEAGFGAIDLFVRTTDPSGGSDVNLYVITEVFGRWHKTESL